jgi:hypothetical protein
MPKEIADTNDGHLISDARIAGLLSVSRSWVRKERFNRRHGLPHTLSIDPIMIGSLPRYKYADILQWIETIRNSNSQRAAENAA